MAALAVVTSAEDVRADAKADAAHHWETAVGLRDSGDYSGAICELKMAYELSPEPAVLLALGKAYITLDKPVEAADALERYLATGRNRIPNENRIEAEIALRKQRERIGTLQLQITPPGAAVSLDGVELGAAPLAKKIRAAAGRHTLVASLAGYTPTTLEVEVTSAKEKAVEVSLQPLPVPKGTIYVECPVPDVLVTANGTGIGTTPLTSPALLQSGEYRIQFERPGYVDADYQVAVSAEHPATVKCGLKQVAPLPNEVKSRLRIVGATHDTETQVDGELVASELDLPSGRHQIRVTRAGYRPWEREIRLKAGVTTDLTPELAPIGTAVKPTDAHPGSTQRTWAYALGAAGLLVGGAAVGLKFWNDEHYVKERDEAGRDYDEVWNRNDQTKGVRGYLTDDEKAEEDRKLNDKNALERKAAIVKGVDIGLAVGAGALLCTGAILWLTSSGDSPVENVALLPQRNGATLSWSGAF